MLATTGNGQELYRNGQQFGETDKKRTKINPVIARVYPSYRQNRYVKKGEKGSVKLRRGGPKDCVGSSQ